MCTGTGERRGDEIVILGFSADDIVRIAGDQGYEIDVDLVDYIIDMDEEAQVREAAEYVIYDVLNDWADAVGILDLKQELSEEQFRQVGAAVCTAYQNGRASLGGLDLRYGRVRIPWAQTEDKWVPLHALRTITIERCEQGTRYTMDYTEKSSPQLSEGEQVCATQES